MTKYVLRDGQLVPWATVARRMRERAGRTRSELPCPSVISDALDGVKNPVDGKRYDSKSQYYQAVKDGGCVIVGNEAGKMADRPPAMPNVGGDEIGGALHKVKQGYKPVLGENDDNFTR